MSVAQQAYQLVQAMGVWIAYLTFDKSVARVAVETNNNLKRMRKQIDLADLFIAATALANDLPFATLNKNHFDRIEGLQILE